MNNILNKIIIISIEMHNIRIKIARVAKNVNGISSHLSEIIVFTSNLMYTFCRAQIVGVI